MTDDNKNDLSHYPDYEEDLLEIEVTSGKDPERIDSYLSKLIKNASRTRVQKSLEEGMVKVNGKIIRKASFKIYANDKIECILKRRPPIKLVPQKMELNIVYEDDFLMVLNKPADMVVHPGVGNRHSTLANGILYYLNTDDKSDIVYDKKVNESEIEASAEIRPGIVHRLDKDTSGLLLIAKTTDVLTSLQEQFADRTVTRTYNALVWGNNLDNSGSIEGNIARSKVDRKLFCVSSREGKYAKTNFTVLERYNLISLLELKLETGRTHQIRVHLNHINHPVLGDKDYKGNENRYYGANGQLNNLAKFVLSRADRQLLHAKSIEFYHPKLNKTMSFTSELPEDMNKIINILKDNYIN